MNSVIYYGVKYFSGCINHHHNRISKILNKSLEQYILR